MMRKILTNIIPLILAFLLFWQLNLAQEKGRFSFEEITRELAGRTAVGDINGDGYNDIVVHRWGSNRGKNKDGLLVWLEYPSWKIHFIKSNDNFFGDAVLIADLNADGFSDIVVSKGNDTNAEIWWYENPGGGAGGEWKESFIGRVESKSEIKDLHIEDMDGDGRLDIAARTKHFTAVYFMNPGGDWHERKIETREREGMTVADLDNDSRPDIILNGFWLKSPDDPRTGDWYGYIIDESWYTDDTGKWQDFSVMVRAADFNGDGRDDVVFSQSEKTGFNLSVYLSIDPLKGKDGWVKIELDEVDYCHNLLTADFDNDGDIDIAAGTLKRLSSPYFVIFNNLNKGETWTSSKIADRCGYKASLGDIDNDGDQDIVSAASWEDAPVFVLRNNLDPPTRINKWSDHLADASIPDRALFVFGEDIDSDGLKDAVAGGWWWRNPGIKGAEWRRNNIGSPLNNACIVYDFDGDGDFDILGTEGKGSASNNNFVWAENDGDGKFMIHKNIASMGNGKFLQGAVVSDFGNGPEIALSWYNGAGGIYFLEVPDDPGSEMWEMRLGAGISQDEDLSAGDIDNDGDTDLLLGTKWLRNDEDKWSAFDIGTVTDLNSNAMPDRNELADINGDGRLDAVVSLENGTQVLWFESPEDPAGKWTRHIIGTSAGEGFSMDAADFDDDGDIDIVVGEHKGNANNSRFNRVIIFENTGKTGYWEKHIIAADPVSETDHHDGTQAVDTDNDGDLDLLSIGWFNTKLRYYENLNSGGKIYLNLNIYSDGNLAELSWNPADSLRISRFEIQKFVPWSSYSAKGHWQKISDVYPAGTDEYTYRDELITLNKRVSYRVKQVDQDGSFYYSETALLNLAPVEVRLLENRPNPFNNSTLLRYSLSKGATIKIGIFSLDGEEILTLFDGEETPGYHEKELLFDKSVKHGIYLCRILVDGKISVNRKILYIK